MRFLDVLVSHFVHSLLYSSFRVHSCVFLDCTPSTSVVLHDEAQNGYDCFGSRPSSCVKVTHQRHLQV